MYGAAGRVLSVLSEMQAWYDGQSIDSGHQLLEHNKEVILAAMNAAVYLAHKDNWAEYVNDFRINLHMADGLPELLEFKMTELQKVNEVPNE